MGVSFSKPAYSPKEDFSKLLDKAYSIVDKSYFDDVKGNDTEQWFEMMELCGAVRVMRDVPENQRGSVFHEKLNVATQTLLSAVDYADEEYLETVNMDSVQRDMSDSNQNILRGIRVRIEGRINRLSGEAERLGGFKTFADDIPLFEDQHNVTDMVKYRADQGGSLSDADREYIAWHIRGALENGDDSPETVYEDVFEASNVIWSEREASGNGAIIPAGFADEMGSGWKTYVEQESFDLAQRMQLSGQDEFEYDRSVDRAILEEQLERKAYELKEQEEREMRFIEESFFGRD